MKNLIFTTIICALIASCGTYEGNTPMGGVLSITAKSGDSIAVINNDTFRIPYTDSTIITCDTSAKRIYGQAVLIGKYIPPVYVRKNLRFEYTSENADALTKLGQGLLSNWNSFGKCCSYSIMRTNIFAKAGKYSIRYELHNDDADVAESKRTEASRYSGDEPTLDERWYGMSYFLDSSYKKDPLPELLTQWQSKRGISPPLAIWTLNGNWVITRHYDSIGKVWQRNDKIIAYDINKWTDWVVHVKWSISGNGLIEAWINGKKIYTYTGANSYAGYPGNYMKNGIYKWPWKTTSPTAGINKRVVYIDEVRIGNASATYNDVVPGNK